MKQLGYRDTYQLKSCLEQNPPDCLMWMDALCAKYDGQGTKFTRKEWDQLLGNVDVVSDWLAIAFAKELIEAYPEAKVILTNRDVDSWYESTLNTVFWRANDPELGWLSHVDWAAGMYYPMLTKFFDTFFEGDFPNRGKEIFHQHYQEVRRLVPNDRLLEYTVTDGWGPLCKFLDTPIPKGEPFPDINDDADFVSRAQLRNKNQMRNVALLWLAWILAALIAIGVVCRVMNVKSVLYMLCMPLM